LLSAIVFLGYIKECNCEDYANAGSSGYSEKIGVALLNLTDDLQSKVKFYSEWHFYFKYLKEYPC
jgi:hypothetical protein